MPHVSKTIHVTPAAMSLAMLLAERLRRLEQAGFAAAGYSSVDDHVGEFKASGLTFFASKRLTRRLSPIRDLLFVCESFALFRRERPDIVATYGLKPGVYARLAARLAGVPVVVHTSWGLFFRDDAPWYRKLPILALEKLAAQLCDYQFSENRDDLARMQRYRFKDAAQLGYLGNATDVHGCFDPARFDDNAVRAARATLGLEPDAVVVGVVGRLTRSKGLDEYFAAARAITGRRSGVQFVVVGPQDPSRGDGVSTAQLQRLQEEGTITWLGSQPHAAMPAIYAALDIVVLMSQREGFPRSLVEAAALARPIIATNIRGCREAVDDGVSGFLVPVRDVRALIQRLETLLDEPALRKRMGAAGRHKALREFDEDKLVAHLAAVYRTLLAQKGMSRCSAEPEPG